MPDALRTQARARLAARGIRILCEDNHLLGVSKPAGLLSQRGPAGQDSLVDHLAGYRQQAEGKKGRAFVGLVHRLDRNVSGALIVAKTTKAARRLSEAFRSRAPGLEKTYLAWVVGRVPESGVLEDDLERRGGATTRSRNRTRGGQRAILRYALEQTSGGLSCVRVLLETGRTHQIRAQFALRGHPLLGDRKYGGPSWTRIALHALSLSVPHPIGQERVRIEAPLPEDLRRLRDRGC